MKNNRLLKNSVLLIAGLLLLSACEPKNEPRWEQEGAHTWTAKETPEDADVKAASFHNYNLKKGYELLKDDKADLTAQVLTPLSRLVLNREFIENPRYRTVRMQQMISIFNAAFVKEYKKTPASKDFAQIKEDYFNTVFAGCTRDLKRDCTNSGLFAADGRHTMIMTMFARELDAPLDAALRIAGSPKKCVDENAECRNMIEERYRRLAMGVYKKNAYQDPEFSFAYLKYARVFSLYLTKAQETLPVKGEVHGSMSFSYLADVHAKIFETIIAKYKPANLNDPEFRSFVENFNPWGYSRKQSDLFQYGTGVMFDLAAQCCLYKDAAKSQLNQSVRDAIAESQKDRDSFGPSFLQMVAEIRKEHGDRLFEKMHILDLAREIESKDGKFFNEYFFIVDRLFRGHLTSGEIEMMLRNTNPQIARHEFPKMIANYVRINLIYMILETNRKMNELYTSDVASDRIFEQAVTQSRALTNRWYAIQAQFDLLDNLMNSYFRDMRLSSPEYSSTFNLLKSVNRNIHYLSAYPSAIVMNYFLAKMNGTISFESWFGKVEFQADTVVKEFFDGHLTEPWFRFGKDTEPLDRLTLLYSFEYMLSTETLNYFVAKDGKEISKDGQDRSKFFDLLFTKYIGDNVDKMVQDFQEYDNKTLGNADFAQVKEVCDYEMKNTGLSRRIILNFTELNRYTYSGLGENSVNRVLSDFLGGSASAISNFLNSVEMHKAYVRAIVQVIEGDLIRTHAIQKAGDPHPDLAKARELLKKLDEVQIKVTQKFVSNHKTYFNCALKLREIERRRANRLYDEEREHLGRIYDLLKPLSTISDDNVLNAKVREINAKYFTAENGYKFDRLDGMTYRMSKYDLLMRMKKRIEDDIFMRPTDLERKNYGSDLQAYIKPRSVTVYIPPGIQNEEMYSAGTNNAIRYGGDSAADREAFIKQGMANLNGQTGSFIEWKAQQEKDTFANYLEGLEAFYLLPPAPGTDPALTVSAKDLADAYLKVTASYFMDAYDVMYAKIFNSYGRNPKAYYQGLLFERDGMTHLPLFYNLMDRTMKLASVDLDANGGVVAESLDFAKRYNSMQAFVFQPSEVVKNAIYTIYGDRAHYRLNRVSELFSYLNTISASSGGALDFDRRFGLPVYLENDVLVPWMQSGAKNLIDNQRLQDHRVGIADFIQRSGNFYGTKEKVKIP